MVEVVAHEFAEVESFLSAAEKITKQPYIWSQYDLLCLPPSFPYGGMENPCLAFLTPTLLAGDRSLAGVVAHEVSHSWTGNLVTNRTWEHFWLNEGWTVWLERRIEAHLHGESWYGFNALAAHASLEEAVRGYGEEHNFTALVPALDGMDPDDAFSVIPYEKGFQLLHHLCEVCGADAFGDFVGAYISAFKMKTITSAEFRDFFTSWCAAREIDSSSVEWDKWLGGRKGEELAKLWLGLEGAIDPSAAPPGASDGLPEGWRHRHTLVFLDQLSKHVQSLTSTKLHRIDELYGWTASKNSEVRFRWQRLCIKLREDFIVPHVVAFLKEQGRMKFVRPLYRDLFAWPEQAHVATATFEEWRANYHPIARKMLAQDLKLVA
eukprot:CAMPEP_0119404024 /NCGR_PEP_ID=MMETSP1334-20130426/143682_1 /TAXON_ID=127549 /ORGANISM="Calcidiscus leptoporus, Strain RCC1130" /LENGTH=377 /DNA_ID=CAMNT_0007427981 /DNA_START=59 /DNA_END=1193 /DNA_ORIENTATION=-